MSRRWLLLVGLALGPVAAGAQTSGDLAARGERVYVVQGCYGCHTVGRAGTPIAPDLSRVGARYSEAQLGQWLRDPAQQKPAAHMPRLELSEDEVRALAAYLATLR